MRTLYGLLIILSIIFLIYGAWSSIQLTEYSMMDIRYSNEIVRTDVGLSLLFAVVSSLYEIGCIVIGIMGLKQLKGISWMMMIPSIFMLLWSGLIFLNPGHISVDEVFLFWILYIITIFFLAWKGYNSYQSEKELDAGILDDGI